jgi:hypothetical protein
MHNILILPFASQLPSWLHKLCVFLLALILLIA